MRDACPICMDSYESDPSTIFVGLVKNCGHYFHFECLWSWLELNQTCPICRVDCDLAEPDLKGLSLKQVLEMAVDISAVHQNQGTLSGLGSAVWSGLGDSPLCGAGVSEPTTDHGAGSSTQAEVTVATVITSQPRTVTNRHSSALIERMKQRFERDNLDLHVQGQSEGQGDGEGHSNPAVID